MDDRELALEYAPIVHFDRAESIPLRAVGFSVIRASGQSPSFQRELSVPEGARCVIEYQYYWDYDIQHMYDLEHIWVTVGDDGEPMSAEASFHGRYFKLWEQGLDCASQPEGRHVQAYCQPGKHAFLPDGQLFRLLPGWRAACTDEAGGGVLVGWPFVGKYASTPHKDELVMRHIRDTLCFEPTLCFDGQAPQGAAFMPWEELREAIPGWIKAELAKLMG